MIDWFKNQYGEDLYRMEFMVIRFEKEEVEKCEECSHFEECLSGKREKCVYSQDDGPASPSATRMTTSVALSCGYHPIPPADHSNDGPFFINVHGCKLFVKPDLTQVSEDGKHWVLLEQEDLPALEVLLEHGIRLERG